jgi:peptide/nickel transport system substrate-binding protein
MRKTLIYLLVAITAVALLAACGAPQPAAEEPMEEAPAAADTSEEAMPSSSYESCLESQAAGNAFCEAPMLAARVEAGELPPVDERLPVNPAVGNNRIPDWQAVMERGEYGGTLRLIDFDAGSIGHDAGWISNEPWVETEDIAHDFATMTGNIFELEISDDDQVFTFHMRKGMKFSDGSDFDTDDIDFWWNDMLHNETLTPVIGSTWRSGNSPSGNVGTMEVVDRYTFKISFDQPYGGWPGLFTYGGGPHRFTDSDYLKKIHGDYADPDELAALLEKHGFEAGEWNRLFGVYTSTNRQHETGLPSLGPYVLTEMGETQAVMERNPYYFKVDEWGQQLPYIDRLEISIVPDVNAATLKIIAGEVDMARRGVTAADMPLYLQNADEKGYEVVILDMHASLGEIYLNMTYAEEGWQEVINEVDFRKALSFAVDRESIIDAVYAGLADPPQTMDPTTDVEQAEALLDGLGLDQRDADGCRLTPSGLPIRIQFNFTPFTGESLPTAEIAAQNWNDIGICTTVKQLEQNLFLTQAAANETQAMVWWAHYPRWPWHESGDYIGRAWQRHYAPLWMAWYDWNVGGGKEASDNADETDPLIVGVEPPQSYKDLRTLQTQLFATSDAAEHERIWAEMIAIFRDNHFWISAADPLKNPLVVSAGLGNVAKKGFQIQSANEAEFYFWQDESRR